MNRIPVTVGGVLGLFMYSTEETEYSGYSRFAGEGLGWAMKVDEEFENKEHFGKGAGDV